MKQSKLIKEKIPVQNKMVLDETTELDPAKDYPFRPSLIKVARCGMCEKSSRLAEQGSKHEIPVGCTCGHSLQGPYITCHHDCKDYVYHHDVLLLPPNGWLYNNHEFPAYIKERPECPGCAHELFKQCDGIHWYPIRIKDGKCEFFRSKNLICKHAVPYLQYEDHFRNHFCTLPPEKRDGPGSWGWEWNCPEASLDVTKEHKCYEPRS